MTFFSGVRFDISSIEVHFFPKNFLPYSGLVPEWLHKLPDRWLGTMIYLQLRKPFGQTRSGSGAGAL